VILLVIKILVISVRCCAAGTRTWLWSGGWVPTDCVSPWPPKHSWSHIPSSCHSSVRKCRPYV